MENTTQGTQQEVSFPDQLAQALGFSSSDQIINRQKEALDTMHTGEAHGVEEHLEFIRRMQHIPNNELAFSLYLAFETITQLQDKLNEITFEGLKKNLLSLLK